MDLHDELEQQWRAQVDQVVALAVRRHSVDDVGRSSEPRRARLDRDLEIARQRLVEIEEALRAVDAGQIEGPALLR